MRFRGKKIKFNWRTITAAFLFMTLILSIIFTIVSLIEAPTEEMIHDESTKSKSDYLLRLVQSLLGVFVMMVPSIIERKFPIEIPDFMGILYFVFLYCAIYLGEYRDFYYVIPYWDSILHAFSAAMLGILGFELVYLLNNIERFKLNLSPFFIALFAFCFAVAAGTVWEIYEYTVDGILGLNMQKFALQDGTLLVGREALQDTMSDIIVDTVSALVTSIVGFIYVKYSKEQDAAKKTKDSPA
ncbi:MAG TPA: hypothetical protein VFD33_07750 [Bacillota bacterium]|nr:hypothetical protein [Bacillota bacterium]